MRNVINRIEDIPNNHCLRTDSYKLSHWVQYPEGTTRMMSYFESRGGPFKECTLFGLQYLLHKYLAIPVTKESVDYTERFAQAHGEPFNRAGWDHILNKYNGRLPVKIRAIKEGTIVPVQNVLLTIECDDPECFWIVSYLETMLVRLWYSSTIATTSRESKKIITKYWKMTSDEPIESLLFKLHDFGARGVTSEEQARLGGAAHLLSFLGSDTMEGIEMANHYYRCAMAGFSIPASEHSTVSMWGRYGEFKMYDNYVDQYLTKREVPEGVPKLAACVSDTYNIYEAVKYWCSPEVVKKLKESGGTLVIRPDSGDPLEVLPKIFRILEKALADEVKVNSKGFKVLPPYIRVIQGDGIDMQSMEEIIKTLTGLKWSIDNIAFGSGGGLLQKVNRDTQKWAFKCCAAMVDGKWVDVRKDPITDPGKQSKAGRLDLICESDVFRTVALEEGQDEHPDSVLVTVFENGDILFDTTFDECRARMEAA